MLNIWQEMGKKGENQAIKELNNISIYTSSLVAKINLKKINYIYSPKNKKE